MLYNVAAGAGGTAGTATHSHTLTTDATHTLRQSAYPVGNESGYSILRAYTTGGALTYYRRTINTDSQAHLYNAVKVLLCKKT